MIPIRPVQVDSTLASPCVRNCCLNAQDICMGCGRLLSEITSWMDFTEEQKRVVKTNAAGRLEALRKQWEK